MDIHLIVVAITILAGFAACVLVVRPTASRNAIARVFAKIALAGAVALFALLGP